VPLSDRDKLILEKLADGRRDKQIAADLDICAGTLRVVIKRICESLEAKTRCQAMAKFVRQEDEDRSG
jgi:DNA-binding NarL/FixJ family response regulator